MRFDLARMVKRPSRRPIALAVIRPTQAQTADLAAIMLRALAPLQKAAIDALTARYEAELVRSIQHDSIDDLGRAIDEIGEAIDRLVLQLTPSLRDWAFMVERVHRGRWQRSILSGTGIDISTLIGPQDAQESIDAFLGRTVSLVRDIGQQARSRIADSVFRGFQARTPPREVGKEIAEAVGMARKRANRVAADQAVKLSSALDAQRQRQAGLDHWKWRSSHKLHFRPEHQARDGKVYTDETAPKDLPGQLPFCGCVRQGVIVFGDG